VHVAEQGFRTCALLSGASPLGHSVVGGNHETANSKGKKANEDRRFIRLFQELRTFVVRSND
jgi:hypothetical protein